MKHPAPYSRLVILQMQEMLEVEAERRGVEPSALRVLDPMAGTGRVHELTAKTTGVEMEPEWAEMHPDTEVGDARNLRFRSGSFDVVCVSPVYGNRMSDHHDARDGSTRRSYTHDLGRPLTTGNAGYMRWDTVAYRMVHIAAWLEVRRVLVPDGAFLLNVSDFISGGQTVHMVEWHLDLVTELGFTLEHEATLQTPRLRFGANRERAEGERVLYLRKGPAYKSVLNGPRRGE